MATDPSRNVLSESSTRSLFESLETEHQLALLRAYSLCFIRLEKPAPAGIATVIAQLDPYYPAKDDFVNAELCRVLSYLDSPEVVTKTIALMKSTQTRTVAYDKAMLERSGEYGEALLKMMSDTPQQPKHSLRLRPAPSAERVDAGGPKILLRLAQRDA